MIIETKGRVVYTFSLGAIINQILPLIFSIIFSYFTAATIFQILRSIVKRRFCIARILSGVPCPSCSLVPLLNHFCKQVKERLMIMKKSDADWCPKFLGSGTDRAQIRKSKSFPFHFCLRKTIKKIL